MFRLRPLINNIQLTCCAGLEARRYAGHSKWQNIKHIKAAKDAQKSFITRRICQDIQNAIKTGGGPNPEINLQLSRVMEQARRYNVPMATIENAIKLSKNRQDNAKPSILEVRGPLNSYIIISIHTDNLNRTKQGISSIFKKLKKKFSYTDVGSSKHYFVYKGQILASHETKNSLEIAEEDAIETGAEEVTINEENEFEFITDPNDVSKVSSNLEAAGYKIHAAEAEYLPTIVVSLPEEELENLSALYVKLQDVPEVMKYYDNVV